MARTIKKKAMPCIQTLQDDQTFAKVVACLRTGGSTVVGRESQFQALRQHLEDSIHTKKGLFLYVTGQPGTGKTLTVDSVIDQLIREPSHDQIRIKKDFINAVQLTHQSRFYQWLYCRILARQSPGVRPPSWQRCQALLSQHFKAKQKAKRSETDVKYILVIDEVDYLLAGRSAKSSHSRSRMSARNGGRAPNDQRIIQSILNWCVEDASDIVVIAISNTVNLLERLDEKCRSRATPPIEFPTYDKPSIQRILEHRLDGNKSLFTDEALTCLASKAQNLSGDIRYALMLGRKALEIARDMDHSKVELKDIMAADRAIDKHFNTHFATEAILTKFIVVALLNRFATQLGKGEDVNVASVNRELCAMANRNELGDAFVQALRPDESFEIVASTLGSLQSAGHLTLQADIPDQSASNQMDATLHGHCTVICVNSIQLGRIVKAVLADKDLTRSSYPRLINEEALRTLMS